MIAIEAEGAFLGSSATMRFHETSPERFCELDRLWLPSEWYLKRHSLNTPTHPRPLYRKLDPKSIVGAAARNLQQTVPDYVQCLQFSFAPTHVRARLALRVAGTAGMLLTYCPVPVGKGEGLLILMRCWSCLAHEE